MSDVIYMLVDSNGGEPKECDGWNCADWLVFNATNMEDFAKAYRIGNEDDDHANTKRALRCFAELRYRYPNAKPGYHPYADPGFNSGVGNRVAAIRHEDGYFVESDLDGIKTYTRMEQTQMIWHVWVDFFLRGDPVAIWIAHARKLGKYFVENMQLPVEEAVAQKFERQGQAAIRNAQYRGQQVLKENGTDDTSDNDKSSKLIFLDRRTSQQINVGELDACDIRVYPNKNWSTIKRWNPKDPYIVQAWLEFNRSWPISLDG